MKSLSVSVVTVFLVLVTTSGVSYGTSAEELIELLDRHEKITLIDVRDSGAYSAGHIPGAINIPVRLVPLKRLPLIGRVIVYGSGLDEGPAMEAVNLLNEKTGIFAELLEGGISRWEALNYPSTRKNELARAEPQYVYYQELEAIARSNPKLVLYDLRKTGKMQAVQSKSKVRSQKIATRDRSLTDLAREFPNAMVISLPLGTRLSNKGVGLALASKLRGMDRDHSKLYVLIDRGEGSAELMAMRLRAAGIKRFVILAGGEESLARKGKSGLENRVMRGSNE